MLSEERIFKPSFKPLFKNFLFHFLMYFWLIWFASIIISITVLPKEFNGPVWNAVITAFYIAALLGTLSLVAKRYLTIVATEDGLIIKRGNRTLYHLRAEEYSLDTEVIVTVSRGITTVNRLLVVWHRETELYRRLSLKYLNEQDFYELEEIVRILTGQAETSKRQSFVSDASSFPQTFQLDKKGNLRAIRKTIMPIVIILLLTVSTFILFMVLSISTNVRGALLLVVLSLVAILLCCWALVSTISW